MHRDLAQERYHRQQRILALLARVRVEPWQWIGITVCVVFVDLLSGPYVRFPVLYLIPVLLAAWCSGWHAGITLAVALPLIRLGYGAMFWHGWLSAPAYVAATVRAVVYSLIAALTAFAIRPAK
jgi:hypothetical protein